MKPFGAFCCRGLLTAALLGLVGCATTSSTSEDKRSTNWSEYAKQWDDMSPVERAESFLWEPFQYALLFGGSALGGH